MDKNVENDITFDFMAPLSVGRRGALEEIGPAIQKVFMSRGVLGQFTNRRAMDILRSLL